MESKMLSTLMSSLPMGNYISLGCQLAWRSPAKSWNHDLAAISEFEAAGFVCLLQAKPWPVLYSSFCSFRGSFIDPRCVGDKGAGRTPGSVFINTLKDISWRCEEEEVFLCLQARAFYQARTLENIPYVIQALKRTSLKNNTCPAKY